jgi:hypothetical protein
MSMSHLCVCPFSFSHAGRSRGRGARVLHGAPGRSCVCRRDHDPAAGEARRRVVPWKGRRQGRYIPRLVCQCIKGRVKQAAQDKNHEPKKEEEREREREFSFPSHNRFTHHHHHHMSHMHTFTFRITHRGVFSPLSRKDACLTLPGTVASLSGA